MRFRLILALVIASGHLFAQPDSIAIAVPFSTDSTHITAWNGEKYVPLFVKGVNLGVSVPGTFPGELAASSADYARWFDEIREAGFNCIRLYTLHYPRFYRELSAYNSAHPREPLHFLQGVWLEEEVPGYNEDLFFLTSFFHREMMENVRAVHGDIQIAQRFGKAHGTFDADVSQWCLAYLVGREIYPAEVLNANTNHPSFTNYEGTYLSIANADPAEAWITAHLDSLIMFEWEEYGTMRPVSASSWPTLDPIPHPEEPHRDEDTAKVDLSAVDASSAPAGMFISYHAYPYYPDFISSNPEYRTYYDAFGMNSYLGYLHDLKSHYRGFPLIIAEFGVPSSWGVAHFSASGMNHGGHTEREQGENALRMMQSIESSGCGGSIYFAWIDEWFKSTWITDPLEVSPSTRVLWPNYTAAEQNFGLMGYVDTVAAWELRKPACQGCKVDEVYAKAEVGEFDIFLKTNVPFADEDTLWIALDTYGDDVGEKVLRDGDTLDIRAEFLLRMYSGKAELMVMRSYDLFGIWHGSSDADQLYRSIASETGDWRPVRWKNNSSVQDIQYIGNFNVAKGFTQSTSTDAVIVDTTSILVRLPWTLLQFVDPSHRAVMDDNRATPGVEYDTTDGIRMQIIWNGESYTDPQRMSWTGWNTVTQVTQVPKRSYDILKLGIGALPDFTLARNDIYTGVGSIFTADVSNGVLANDEQWSGGRMNAVLVEAPEKGFLQLNDDGSFSYIPSVSWNGSDEFTYKVISLGDESETVRVELRGDAVLGEPVVRVGPVPADRTLNVRSQWIIGSVELVASDGKVVMTEQVMASDAVLDVSALSAGSYLMKIRIGEDELLRKLIVY